MEIEAGERTSDQIVIAFGRYGLADGLSRRGKFEESILLANQAISKLEEAKSEFTSVAYQELGRAQLQASDYENAVASLGTSARLVLRFRVSEVSIPTFALLAEALLGVDWHQDGKKLSRRARAKAARAAWKARLFARVFPNSRPHAMRVSGRLAKSRNRVGKAIQYFDRALEFAKQLGSNYEIARALIDKSMIEHENAATDRDRGIELLENLECVLPMAEQEYLGIEMTHYPLEVKQSCANKVE